MKQDRCRVCLTETGTMTNIFLKKDQVMISAKIMCFAKVRIYPGDGLPTLICSICSSKLHSCIEFVRLCEASDKRLRSLTVKIEEINNSGTENYDTDSDNDVKGCSIKLEVEEDLNGNNKSTGGSNVVKEITDCSNTAGSFTNKGKKKKCRKKEVKIRPQCNICGRVMSSMHRLKTHLVTHTGERPFTCKFCNKNFTLDENLKVHLRVHTGEKPYQCTVCGESFAQSSGFITHKRKHTGQLPYKCLLCPRRFRTIGHMQYHTKRHTGEKKFECDKCTRTFITRGDLNHHRTIHSGDRPHVCSVCGLRLTRASNLKRHMQKLHGDVNAEESTADNKHEDI